MTRPSADLVKPWYPEPPLGNPVISPASDDAFRFQSYKETTNAERLSDDGRLIPIEMTVIEQEVIDSERHSIRSHRWHAPNAFNGTLCRRSRRFLKRKAAHFGHGFMNARSQARLMGPYLIASGTSWTIVCYKPVGQNTADTCERHSRALLICWFQVQVSTGPSLADNRAGKTIRGQIWSVSEIDRQSAKRPIGRTQEFRMIRL